jgi:hypothetical protein
MRLAEREVLTEADAADCSVSYSGVSARLPLSTRTEAKEKRTATDFRPSSRPKFRDFASLTQGRCGDRHRLASD